MIMVTDTAASSAVNQTDSPFVRYVEVWVANEEATALNLVSARSVDDSSTAATRTEESFASGEGPAGAAWKQKSAVILQEEPSSVLNRISSSSGVDLSAVLAVPIFRQLEIRGVIVFGLGPGFGAAEVWSRLERDELAVTGSYYSGLPSFEFITRHTRFPKGAGVPGRVWMSGHAQMAHNLDKASTFIRSFGNDPANVTGVLGLPVATTVGFPASILLLLEAANSPWSRCTELIRCRVEEPQEGSSGLILKPDVGEILGAQEPSMTTPWRSDVVSAVGRELGPVVVEGDSGTHFHVAWPVFEQDQPTSVVSLTF